jgi:putative SbcD/Mre11-related phosphoesterase
MTARLSRRSPGTVTFDDWQLTSEGAAIHAGERTAVIADVHLGYEWARGAAGDCVPAHSLAETLARLESVLGRAPVVRLIVAGDLVESSRSCARTSADVQQLRTWLEERGVSLKVLEGNHDASLVSSASVTSWELAPLPAKCCVGGWTVGHGHRPLAGTRTVSGHHHPVFRFEGTTAPCFLVGPGRIMLPAFSPNAAGCDVTSSALPDEWRAMSVRCIVSAGRELLDFGPLCDLRGRLRRSMSGPISKGIGRGFR